MGGWVSPRARPVSSGDGAPANVPAGDWRCTDRSRSWSLGCFGELRRVLRRLGSLDGRLDGEGSQNAAMRHAFRPELAGDLTETYELHVGDNVFEVRVAGGQCTTRETAASDPDVVIELDAETLNALLMEGPPPREAIASGGRPPHRRLRLPRSLRPPVRDPPASAVRRAAVKFRPAFQLPACWL